MTIDGYRVVRIRYHPNGPNRGLYQISNGICAFKVSCSSAGSIMALTVSNRYLINRYLLPGQECISMQALGTLKTEKKCIVRPEKVRAVNMAFSNLVHAAMGMPSPKNMVNCTREQSVETIAAVPATAVSNCQIVRYLRIFVAQIDP